MFKNKVVVITGAGSGIGRELAIQMAEAGARLALSDINRIGLDETLRRLPAGSQVKGYLLDVASWEAFQAHADEVKRDFGTAHYVINNAGATVIGTVANTSIEEFEWQLGINLWGVLYGTKAFLPMMLEQREGCVVNISSIFGLLGYPMQSAYNMSKFAIRGLTECLWSELDKTGVRAVCVHPGGIKTNIEKSGRRCKAAGAEENKFVAQAAAMLQTPADECAADIIKGLRKGSKRIMTGHKSSTVFWLSRLFPNRYPTLLKLLG
ncbi:SDR family NAD(P)-dependent oxidoreductase [Pseudomonas sp. TH39(2020)]|uniref:SDR family NAD(P)-dependent oxidoreductase n=1 Tax=Pseudomonas sp. TH39(2020) TaxID=2796349 RepID=UPI001914BE44|nr:SDR family NAD(P)-dependent oxidoreductase [Pseudomonas sp. TH39(2020)]MBK5396365.1 SDR family NAD(P)-dependent oxidoreductase [Pseudomonas sp. TH39(2020)]